MSKTATATLAVSVQGDGLTLTQATVLTNGSASPPSTFTIAGGTNLLINFPAGSTRALIVPPPGNAIQLTLKGAPTDSGIALALTDPTFLPMNASGFYIGPPSTVTFEIYWC